MKYLHVVLEQAHFGILKGCVYMEEGQPSC